MNSVTICLLGLIILLVLLFSGIPIAIAMLAVGFLGYAVLTTPKAALAMICTGPYATASSYNFSVILFFTLMGNLCFEAGLSRRLFDLGQKWLNWLPGGLSAATVAACALFGAICGSPVATTSTMATVAAPEMRRYGYSDTIVTGTIAASGGLGALIPPSTAFIIYGITTETSIGQLFAAGIIPGIVLAVFFIATDIIWVKVKPDTVSIKPGKFTWGERFKSLLGILPVLILFLFVMGGMFIGAFTSTEAAVAGCFGSIVLMLINKTFTMKTFVRALLNSLRTAAMVYFVMMGANMLGYFFSIGGVTTMLGNFITSSGMSRFMVMLLIVVIYLVMGCFMDTMAIFLITMPIFQPILLNLNYDLIWFGVFSTVLGLIGNITPPVGVNAYVCSGIIKDVSLGTIFKGCVPYICAYAFYLVLLWAIPGMATWLPAMLY